MALTAPDPVSIIANEPLSRMRVRVLSLGIWTIQVVRPGTVNSVLLECLPEDILKHCRLLPTRELPLLVRLSPKLVQLQQPLSLFVTTEHVVSINPADNLASGQ